MQQNLISCAFGMKLQCFFPLPLDWVWNGTVTENSLSPTKCKMQGFILFLSFVWIEKKLQQIP